MKNLVKKIAAAALVSSMLFSFASCSKVKFEAVKSKDIKNAIEDTFDVDDDEYYETDGSDCKNVWYYEKNIVVDYYQFDDADDAYDLFEDIYDDFEDMIEDKDFDGKYKSMLKDESGYILVKGTSDSDDFYDDDVYGGIYFVDDVVVIVMATSDKDKDIEKVNSFLEAIGYSHL